MPNNVQRRSSTQTALWIALGASAGVAIAILLANRTPRGRALLRDLRRLLGRAAEAAGDLRESAALFAAEDDELAEPDEPGVADASGRADSDETDDEGSDDGYVDTRVLAAFENDPVLAERAIDIDEPEPGVIVLTGRVSSSRDAAHAVTIARGTPGVNAVENLLRVRRPSRR